MVVKKKRTYKKQKGGLVLSKKLPIKLTTYFDCIKYLINMFYDVIDIEIDIKFLPMLFERINELKSNIENIWICSDNIYLQNLAKKINKILERKNTNTVKRYKDLILEILKCALLEVFFTIFTNKLKLTFLDILKKIFINILFIDYLNLDIQDKNKHVLNEMFEEKIMKLLNILFHITSLYDKEYLISLLRILFLEEYQREYNGIPVFYGNTLDSYHNLICNLGYNQFICEKVGVSSKDKRNYIINPVGALAWMYIDKQNYKNTPLYDLLRKILRFDYVQGNKRQGSFTELPKLEHLRQTTTKFCIAIDPFNNEEVYQEPRNDLSMCSKLYGCSLKMTAEIRRENIASDEHILELLSILLEEQLDKRVSNNIVSSINEYDVPPIRNELQNMRLIQEFNHQRVNPQVERNRMKRRNIYKKQKQETMKQNNNELRNFKTRLRSAIKEINTELKKNIYSVIQRNKLNEKKRSLQNYLIEISESNNLILP